MTTRLCLGPGCRNELAPLKSRGHPRLYCSVRCRSRAYNFRRKALAPPVEDRNALPPRLKTYLAGFDALLRARSPREVVEATARMVDAPTGAGAQQRELEHELPRGLLPNHAEYQFLRNHIDRSEDHARTGRLPV